MALVNVLYKNSIFSFTSYCVSLWILLSKTSIICKTHCQVVIYRDCIYCSTLMPPMLVLLSSILLLSSSLLFLFSISLKESFMFLTGTPIKRSSGLLSSPFEEVRLAPFSKNTLLVSCNFCFWKFRRFCLSIILFLSILECLY